ncbi:MAG: PRD domain-containing protein [Peptostreptococcaceae bacterium]
MIIKKIYNNNIVLAIEDNKEIVVIGCGIGFKKLKDDLVDLEKIEKKFVSEDSEFHKKINDLSKIVSDEIFNITSEIISHSENVLGHILDEYRYISLTDHISFAIKRYEDNLLIKNELLDEIKKVYRAEYELGIWAIGFINEKMNVNFDINEAGFIAMHIINANHKNSFVESKLIMEIVSKSVFIIKEFYDIDFDEDDINYDRLLIHLKFFVRRIIDNTSLDVKDNSLLKILKFKYIDCYNCASKIKNMIESIYDYDIGEDEIFYLTLHINRVTSNYNLKL